MAERRRSVMSKTQINANQYNDVYADLGISIPALGVVMLDTDPIQITEMVDNGKPDLYTSENPERFWIAGAVAETKAHVTLLYGLLQQGLTWRSHIDRVLDGWTPPELVVSGITSFPSPFEDEDYSCIVALIEVSAGLTEGHQRLQLLPHIDTFAGYKPHLTLAYVKKSAEKHWLENLGTTLVGKKLAVNKLNYGGNQS
jgi:2'-5' RNA ligase